MINKFKIRTTSFMKTTKISLIASVISISVLSACSQKTILSHKLSQDSALNMINVSEVKESKDFPNAALSISSINTEKVGADSVKFKVKFLVQNYELTKMTMDMNMGECANSDKGQHIHYILDNKPYAALYKPENTVTLPINSEHYLLSFLSRSYHESIKSPAAAVLIHFKIDGQGNYVKLADATTPMLFYSRPKGEYTGKDTQNILLDFYVKNTTLSKTGNRVRLSINDRQFILTKWQPYFLKNVCLGKVKFKLELLDSEGKNLTGDNTTIERMVTLK
jgi:hypothetical protein